MIDNANELTKQILLLASKAGARLWRRNVGMAWAGASTKFTAAGMVSVQAGDVLVRRALPFHNGVAGQYDTYGFKPVVITPEMVGTTVAVHVEIEIKFGRDRVSTEQAKWGEFCGKNGVLAGVARTVDDATRILN